MNWFQFHSISKFLDFFIFIKPYLDFQIYSIFSIISRHYDSKIEIYCPITLDQKNHLLIVSF